MLVKEITNECLEVVTTGCVFHNEACLICFDHVLTEVDPNELICVIQEGVGYCAWAGGVIKDSHDLCSGLILGAMSSGDRTDPDERST